MVGSDRLNAPAIDTFSHCFEWFHMPVNSVSPSWLGCSTIYVHCTPPPCKSYAKVPNYYGLNAYCSLDKAVDAHVQKEKIAC